MKHIKTPLAVFPVYLTIAFYEAEEYQPATIGNYYVSWFDHALKGTNPTISKCFWDGQYFRFNGQVVEPQPDFYGYQTESNGVCSSPFIWN